jgi:hypothetical protein
MVKLIHHVQILDLTYMLYLCLIILLLKDDVPVDSETLLVIDFVNLKISRLNLLDVLIGTGCACIY